MPKKPSFLERLTGAMEEGEEIVEKNLKGPSKTANPQADDNGKQDNDGQGVNGEWLPEAEGQLTIDVYQTPSDIVIKSTIAGVKPDDLDITITNDMVTIRGKREKDQEIKTENYYYQECYWGAFSRSIILPLDIEAEKAEAIFKNGILTIRLPKIEKVKTKKIKIKTE